MFKHGTHKVIVLSGSTRFKDEYMETEAKLALAGHIALLCPVFHHADGINLSASESELLLNAHRQRIDMADEMLVINPGGYVGEQTAKEIAYAESLGKAVNYLV